LSCFGWPPTAKVCIADRSPSSGVPTNGGESKINSLSTFIGIDIGERTCVACIMDDDGNILERTKYPNKRATASAFTKYAAAKYNGCTAVFEATGNYGFKTQLALEGHHIPYKIAKPPPAQAGAVRPQDRQDRRRKTRKQAPHGRHTGVVRVSPRGQAHTGHTARPDKPSQDQNQGGLSCPCCIVCVW
ncbi:MAG: transposase, partial [Nitrosopumilaceae archaeon]|nr:transposase [Nitrosopumilaceae archaeon]